MYKFALKKNLEVWFTNEDDKKIFERNRIILEQKTNIVPGAGVIFKDIDKKKQKTLLSAKNWTNNFLKHLPVMYFLFLVTVIFLIELKAYAVLAYLYSDFVVFEYFDLQLSDCLYV